MEVFVRIIGIDPGIAIVGYGMIDHQGNRLIPVQYGSIQTDSKKGESERLYEIYENLRDLVQEYKPEVMGVEKLFFNRNVTTAFMVGQARGIILLVAEQAGIPIFEYTPLQVKQAVVGYGQAEKRQVQEMVKVLLSLSKIPKPDDVADALGVAITHAHSSQITRLLNGGSSK
jgi:crossover junction endodeoxyribonuclease RuvC